MTSWSQSGLEGTALLTVADRTRIWAWSEDRRSRRNCEAPIRHPSGGASVSGAANCVQRSRASHGRSPRWCRIVQSARGCFLAPPAQAGVLGKIRSVCQAALRSGLLQTCSTLSCHKQSNRGQRRKDNQRRNNHAQPTLSAGGLMFGDLMISRHGQSRQVRLSPDRPTVNRALGDGPAEVDGAEHIGDIKSRHRPRC